MVKKKRKAIRQGIIANFQFYIDDRSEEIFEGLTMNVSPHGFRFLTKAHITEGQTITITEHTARDLTGRKAHVIWVKNDRLLFEAGAEV